MRFNPIHSGVGNVAVIGSVGTFPGTTVGCQFGCYVIGWRVIAKQANGPADATNNMHRQHFLREAVVILSRAIVELADGGGFDAAVTKPMHPAFYRSVIGCGAVPEPGLVNMPSTGQGCTGRHAHRRGGVGVGEPRAAPGEPVKVGRLHNRMPVASHGIATMLVRDDHQQIWWCGWKGFHFYLFLRIQGVDPVPVQLANDMAPDLESRGHLAVLGGKWFIGDDVAPHAFEL